MKSKSGMSWEEMKATEEEIVEVMIALSKKDAEQIKAMKFVFLGMDLQKQISAT